MTEALEIKGSSKIMSQSSVAFFQAKEEPRNKR